MKKINKTYFVILAAVFLAACSQPKDFPKNARLCGNYFISCVAVKKGMYRCRVYSRWRKKLLADKNYIYPFFYQGVSDEDLTRKITEYDGDTIYFEGNRKLLKTDLPEDAVAVQSLKEGVWVSCKADDARKNTYICIIYDMKGVNTLSTGRYVLKRFYWDSKAGRTRYQDLNAPAGTLSLVYYGGVGISLRDKMVLLPKGWIDYPSPDGRRGGLRVEYGSQANVIKEEEY